jgi:hypothetical protein
MFGGEEVYPHPFFISALETVEQSAPFTDRFTSGKINSDSPRKIACVVYRGIWTFGEGKIFCFYRDSKQGLQPLG